MSTATTDPTEQIEALQADADAAPARKPKPRASGSAGRSAEAPATYGSFPKVDLLPQEVRDRAAVGRVRSRAILAVILAVIVVVAAVALAFYNSVAAGVALASEQARTSDLLLQQQQYAEVNTVKQSTAAVTDAQKLGAWTEIDWKAYLTAVQATVPEGMTITATTVDSASATETYAQASVPLQGPRVATLTFTATSPDIPAVPDWLDALAGLAGFVDATPSSVTQGDGGYQVSMTLHVSDAAFSNRFADTPADAAADTTADDAAGSN